MDPEILLYLFGVNHYATKANLEGISQAESLRQPDGGGHCMNWIFGHIVASRNGIFKLLNESPIWADEQVGPYKRGTPETQQANGMIELQNIHDDFDESQKRLVAALERLTLEDYQKKIGDKDTLGQKLSFLHFHEAYHIGQLGLLRRIVGKPCAIK